MAQNDNVRYLNPPTVEVRNKKYCRFKKAGIKYVDYKDPEFPAASPVLPSSSSARLPRPSSAHAASPCFLMLLTSLNNPAL